MSGYHCSRKQGFDLIQRAQPLTSGLFIALSEVRVRVVVDRIPRAFRTTSRPAKAEVLYSLWKDGNLSPLLSSRSLDT